MNVATLLEASARSFGERTAWIWGERRRSYAETHARACALARAFLAAGLMPGERVALILDNCPEILECMFAAWKAGLVVVPLNARFTVDEIVYHVGDAGARVLVTGERQAETVAAARAELPALVRVFQFGGSPLDRHEDFEQTLAAHDHGWLPARAVARDDLAWLAYTSGTTGRAKGAMLSHGVLVFEVLGMLADFFPLDASHVGLHAAPLTHGSGHAALAFVARACAQVILAPSGFDAEAFFSAVQSHRVNALFLVPTIIKLLTEHPRRGDYDLASLRWVFYGGSPMYVEDLQRAHRAFGPIFIQGFGQTESPMTGTFLPAAEHDFVGPHRHRLASCGRARSGVEVAILGDDDRLLPADEVGEIGIRGASVMLGYWRRPEDTAATLRNGWLHTGDLGRMDSDGYVYILDRSKDMVISGGLNIYPREVEEILLTHPAVAEACAFGVPDPKWGEALIAHVVRRAGESVDEAALQAFVGARAAPYKKPKRIQFVEALARTTYGKVDKKAERAPYWVGRDRLVG